MHHAALRASKGERGGGEGVLSGTTRDVLCSSSQADTRCLLHCSTDKDSGRYKGLGPSSIGFSPT